MTPNYSALQLTPSRCLIAPGLVGARFRDSKSRSIPLIAAGIYKRSLPAANAQQHSFLLPALNDFESAVPTRSREGVDSPGSHRNGSVDANLFQYLTKVAGG